MIKISEEENNFSEISSEREEGILFLGSVAGASVTSNAIYNYTELLLLFMLMN
jgi:peptidase E